MDYQTIIRNGVDVQAANKVLSDTYRLLTAVVGVAALTAVVGMQLKVPPMGLLFLVPYFFVLWMINRNATKASGIAWVFVLAMLLGITLSPMLNMVMSTTGANTVIGALAGTAAGFMAATAIGRAQGDTPPSEQTLKNNRIASYAILAMFVTGIMNYLFITSSLLAVALSAGFAGLSLYFIASTTRAIIYGGETNYIQATTTLLVMLYNLFASLLHLLWAFAAGEE